MNDRIALSVPEAAACIGISKSKMYELIRRDDADFTLQIGGRRLVSRSKLEARVERQTEARV